MANNTSAIADVPSSVDFPTEEEKILAYWKEIDAFKKSLELSEGRPEFTFYDGPPFATGLPHYGHLLAGTIKDCVTRYAHMNGHYVSRRFGWDCHGLPVEYEIDQMLKITDRDQIVGPEGMGIAAYNAECRKIVTRYTKEWEVTVSRMGRWIDFENDYKTMLPWFMESVWWVFKTMFEKGLVYRGYKVMPYSTACSTPLSNFEAGLNYKDVKDPAIVVSFPVEGEEASLLAWTTTPWTLPSNLALCVNVDFDYVKVRDVAGGKVYYLAKERLCQLYPQMLTKKWKPEKAGETFEILEELKGAALVGRRYAPLFPYFAARAESHGNFRVVSDGYVTSDSGTGIVHQAPAFGEDDYRVCLEHGLIAKDEEAPCPVDFNGRFTEAVADFQGRHIKEADADICAHLKERGRLVQKAVYDHSYPFCWRSDTPLIYKAVPSWFVSVEKIKERLLANNDQTYWVPAFVKEKRFHNWLRDAKDWAISRNRFWGTPIPLWCSDDYQEIVAVGSVDELEALSGVRVEDLHREHIDHITIPSKEGRGALRRVDEVFDCWFESGSMPYAQQHYPFENKERFEAGFPADFIAEGLDQTRGWFYTLMVISTALFDKPAFKNLIVNGLVLAGDGKKMSKRLKNYPDPSIVVSKYGADALRLYLVNSPVVRAEPLRFKEEGVLAVVKDVFLPWYNAFRFFMQNARRWELTHPEGGGRRFAPDAAAAAGSANPTDAWILAAKEDLIKFVRQEMGAYRLYTVVPELLTFLNHLTNWYIRLNRDRLKGKDGPAEAHAALCCLYDVLFALCLLMAPLTPFFAETLYQHLRPFRPEAADAGAAEDAPGKAASVHYCMIPAARAGAPSDAAIGAKMAVLRRAVELGRVARERRALSLKHPVRAVVVVCADRAKLDGLRELAGYVRSELNAVTLELTADEDAWCKYTAETNNKALGKRLGKDLRAVRAAAARLTNDQLRAFQAGGALTLEGHALGAEDLVVRREFIGDTARYEADTAPDGSFVVALDTTRDAALEQMGTAREVVNRVQKLRKAAGLQMEDAVEVFFEEEAGKTAVAAALAANVDLLAGALGAAPLPLGARAPRALEIAREEAEVAGSRCVVAVCRPCPVVDAARVGAQAAGVETLLASLDPAALAAAAAGGEPLEVTLDGRALRLRPGADFFLSRTEQERAARGKK